MLLIDILFNSAQKFPQRPALTMRMGYRTTTLTYQQVEQLSKKIALFLADQGVVAGDCILLCAPNSPYWVCIFWACLLQGYYVVPLAMQSTQDIINKIAEQTQAKVFFKSMHVRFSLPHTTTFLVELITETVKKYDAEHFVLPAHDPHSIAQIMYTSGTTGDPKGVMLTHENIGSNVQALNSVFCLSEHERILSVLPLSHMLEQIAGFLMPFSIGAHIIYAHSHGAIKDLLRQYRITKMMSVPEFLKLMANRLQATVAKFGIAPLFKIGMKIAAILPYKPLQRLLFFPAHRGMGGSLDTIASGGAALDEELEIFWNKLGFYILQGYGLTETSPVVTINTYQARRIGSAGKPLPGVNIRLTHDGEIEVQGPNVFKGYYKNEAKTRESFTEDGWFKTGDIGFLDKDGFLFLKGRKKYMIKGAGAQNIFPEDIENVLNAISGVKDSCVVGIERHAGLEIHAVILLSDTAADVEQIISQANARLASYQHINGWSVWPDDDFPRSAIRKVKKEVVLAWLKEKHHEQKSRINGMNGPLVSLVAEVTGVTAATIHPTTKLIGDLKLDSLMRVELVTRIEECHGVLIDERLINAKTTVADLEYIIAHAAPIKKIPRVKKWPRSWWARASRSGLQDIILLFPRLFFKVNVEGDEHLNELKESAIFMPNHVSLIDGLIVMMALPRRLRKKISFAAAYDVLYQDYWAMRPLAELLANAFPFPRREQEHVATGLLNMGIMLDDGYNVVVFPEGRMSEDGKLQPLKRGTGLVVIEMSCPVVPIMLKGVEDLIPYNCLIPRKRGTITVIIGKPITFDRTMSYDQATQKVEQVLRSMM